MINQQVEIEKEVIVERIKEVMNKVEVIQQVA